MKRSSSPVVGEGMAERLVAAFVKKNALTTQQREGVIALAAEFERVPLDRIVVREVSPQSCSLKAS